MIKTQTSFVMGAIGDRLDFDRSNEIFDNSCKSILNAYVSSIKTLRVMKDTTNVLDLNLEVINVQETDGDFVLVVHPNSIVTVGREDSKVISTLSLTKVINSSNQVMITKRIGSNKSIDGTKIPEFFLISITNSDFSTDFYKCDIDGSNLIAYDFLAEISKPLENKNIVYADIYEVYNVAANDDSQLDPQNYKPYLSIRKIGSQEENLLITVNNGEVSVAGTAGKVRRIYFEDNHDFILSPVRLADQTTEDPYIDMYIVQPDEDTSTVPAEWLDLKHGDIIINFYNYTNAAGTDPDESPLLLLFKEIGFTGFANPAGFQLNNGKFTGLKTYYSAIEFKDGTNNGTGRVLQGDQIDLTDKIKNINIFQNRLVIMTEDVLYFSRTGEFEDFTNDIESDSPFYIKLSPIANVMPRIITSMSSQGLFILTDRGVNVVNYQETLTPETARVVNVSQIPTSWQCEMIDTNLFFVGKDKELYSVQENRDNGENQLYGYKVEKFKLTQSVTSISRIKIERDFRLIVCEEGVTDRIKMYSILATDTFANVEYELDHNGMVKGVDNTFFASQYRKQLSDNNKTQVDILLHQPDIFTDLGGSLFNDENTVVTRFTSSIINSDNDQVKSLIVAGEGTLQLGTILGRSSLYEVGSLFQAVSTGIPVTLELNQGSTGVVEISGFEYFYEPASKYGK